MSFFEYEDLLFIFATYHSWCDIFESCTAGGIEQVKSNDKILDRLFDNENDLF